MNLALLLAAGVVLNGVAAILAFRRRSVDLGGALAGTVVGAAIFGFGGPLFWVVLMAFFVTSTAAGRVRHREKEWLSTIHQKGERRDVFQVLANGGLGAITSILFYSTGRPAWAAAFAVSFAASNADTWASEIGVLSRSTPVTLFSLRPVPRGISGGVTVAGSLAAVAGALLIGMVFALENLAMGILPGGGVRVLLFVGAGGVVGSFVDSLLGATVQARYASNDAPGVLTERRLDASGARNPLVRGLPFVNNDAVNFLSGIITTGLAAAAAPLVF